MDGHFTNAACFRNVCWLSHPEFNPRGKNKYTMNEEDGLRLSNAWIQACQLMKENISGWQLWLRRAFKWLKEIDKGLKEIDKVVRSWPPWQPEMAVPA